MLSPQASLLNSPNSTSLGRGLSRELWGIRWEKSLPFALAPGIQVVQGTYDELTDFATRHFEDIYDSVDQADIHFKEATGANRRSFYSECADIFLFKQGTKTIGNFTGNPLDWSTYYLRNCSVLKEFQGHSFQAKYLRFVLGQLEAAGVARAELDVSPSNLGQIQTFTRMRFNVTGVSVSERWGTLLRFTKFLQPDCEATFLENFCYGVKYQTRTKKKGAPP